MTTTTARTAPPAPADPATTDGFVVRALASTDWPAACAVDGAAFGYVPDREFMDEVVLPTLDIRRFTGVFDPALGSRLVGIAAIQPRELTLPGNRTAPVAAVTWVGVRPDQQRRGILRQMMTHQLHGLHRDGSEPLAILTASEAAIYGRFGYGHATDRVRMEISTPTRLRSGTPTEPVLEMEVAEALAQMKSIHSDVRATTPGFLNRTDAIWDQLLSEHPEARSGRPPRRYVLHAQGYAVFRIAPSWSERGPDSTLTISELTASTPVARSSIWQHLLNHPLVTKVVHPQGWVDEPLQEILGNERQIGFDKGDHVWVRVVDLDRALQLRGFTGSLNAVVAVSDEFCPWNDGTWELDLGPSGGSARRSSATPQVRMSIDDVGAAFLGGNRIARRAAAGRVTGEPAVIEALNSAFGSSLAPFTPEGF